MSTQPSPQVNGDVQHYRFFEHLQSIPVVNDVASKIKTLPLAETSIKITDSAYRTVQTYLGNQLQYLAPYVKKADDMGDNALSSIEEKFPVVKKPTNEIISDAKTIAFFPVRVSLTGKDHLINTYNSECERVSGGFVRRHSTAFVATFLTVGTDVFTKASALLKDTSNGVKARAEEQRQAN